MGKKKKQKEKICLSKRNIGTEEGKKTEEEKRRREKRKEHYSFWNKNIELEEQKKGFLPEYIWQQCDHFPHN